MKSSIVLLMAGSGTRSGLEINKVLYQINKIPLFMYSLEKFNQVGFDEYILVVSKNDFDIVNEYMENSSLKVIPSNIRLVAVSIFALLISRNWSPFVINIRKP